MIIETKEVYKCEHCRKLYQIKSACERHELKCKKNPDNFQKCYDSNYLSMLITKAKKSWKGIDGDDWISNLRGDYER